ncbi:MAG: Wzz/FepE/Etk N-terminal domain-containing protein [Hyphomicrobiales bacterium]|nr:Wzz/FepE/Etk N-terminal domain-containing protein [Hyphomicrobiales bacterium]
MSGVKSSASDVDVDLGRLFGSLVRRWKRILFVALVATALALAFAWLATPRYKGETRILIETRESVFTRPQGGAEDDRPLLDEEGVTSQVEVIGSVDLLKQVALKLDLSSRPEFDEAANMSLLSRILVVAGLKTDPNEIPPEERVLKAFREKLTVYRVEKSRVIVIEMSSKDPKLAAEIPNALADAYIAGQGAAKQLSNSEATDWLEPEIASLSKRVKEAEARVASFRARSDLLIGQNNSVLATQQLSELSTELSRVRANRGAAEANASSVRAVLESGGSLDALPEVLSSPLIQRLRERQVQLKADIADLSTTLLDNHPRLRALRSQLTDLDRQIRTEAQNVLKALSSEANAAQLREKQLLSDLNSLKTESARAGEEEVELRALEREANAQRSLLESYLSRYREASSRGDGNYLPADARIFARAIVPSEPYYPKPLPIAGAAFVGSLLVMALVTLLQELFSGRAMRPAVGSRLEPETEAADIERPVKPLLADPVESEAPFALPEAVRHEPPAFVSVEPAAADIEPAAPEPEVEVMPIAAEVETAFADEADPVEQPTGVEVFEAEAEAEPKPAIAEEIASAAALSAAVDPPVAPPVAAPVAPPVASSEPERVRPEPIRHDPLPEMRVERASFVDAWERHKRTMDAARYVEPAPPAEAIPTAPAIDAEIEEQPVMRNPFARRKATSAAEAPRAEPEAQPEAAQSAVGEVGIHRAAELLISGGAARAIFVSPQGDEGAATAVLVAREVADAGLRVLLIDLTASGAVSRPMLDSVSYPGITNLLASEAQFTEAIHVDHYSECHVMPVGTADPMRAMKAANRLPGIMQSLTEAYDVVMVECGASDAEGIRRLVADGTEIMVSSIERDDETTATAEALMARGYGRVMLVSPAANGSPDAPVPGRSAA